MAASTTTTRRRKPLRTDLTESEALVVVLLCKGLSNRAIARSVGVSEGTIKKHVSAALRKTDTTNRVELALYFLRCPACDKRPRYRRPKGRK